MASYRGDCPTLTDGAVTYLLEDITFTEGSNVVWSNR